MSNTLTKDTSLLLTGYTTDVIPGTSPAPAYCVDTTVTTTGFTSEYVTVPPDPHVPGSGGTYTILVGPTTVTSTYHECFPATSGTPDQTLTTPNFTTSRNQGWNGGAISIGVINVDGQFKFSAPAGVVGVVAGLSDVNVDAGYIEIKWGIYCRSGVYSVIEAGVEKTAAFGYASTDVFAIARINGVITYWKNGTLIYTSDAASTGAIFADSSLYMGGDQITNASIDTTVDVAFQPMTGSVAGTLGQLQGFSFGGGLTSWNSVQGTLGQLVGSATSVASYGEVRGTLGQLQVYATDSAVTSYVACQGVLGQLVAAGDSVTCRGTLGQLVGEAYSSDVGAVCAGVLGQLVGHAESGLLMPSFAGSDGTLSRVTGFAVALAGMAATCQGVLGGLRGFAANAPNIAGVQIGDPLPPASDPTGYVDPTTGDWTGRSGGQLRMLVGFSYDSVVAERSAQGGHIRLPRPLDVTGSIIGGDVFNTAIRLPWPLVVSGYFGISGDLTLPLIELDASGTIDNTVRGDLQLPGPVTVAATALAGTLLHGNIALPLITVRGTFGAPGAKLTLPKLQLAGRIVTDLALSANLRLPLIGVAGSISATYGVLSGHLVLPMLVMASSGVAALELPRLRLAGTISQGAAQQTRLAYAMNLSHGALTTFSNFGFKQFARAYNRYFAVGLDGNLFIFGGDRDGTSVIDWEWRSGLADFGSPGQKGVLGVYIDGEIQTAADVVIVTDDATRIYSHQPKGAYNNHKPHRVSTGRGVRSRNLAFGMASALGGYIEIDSITPEYVITSRNI